MHVRVAVDEVKAVCLPGFGRSLMFGDGFKRQHGSVLAHGNTLARDVGGNCLMLLLGEIEADGIGVAICVQMLSFEARLDQLANQLIERGFIVQHGKEFELLVLFRRKFKLRLQDYRLRALWLPGVLKQEFGQEMADADVILDAVVLDCLLFVAGDFDPEEVAARLLCARPQAGSQIRSYSAFSAHIRLSLCGTQCDGAICAIGRRFQPGLGRRSRRSKVLRYRYRFIPEL
jgi:hypothetical protein